MSENKPILVGGIGEINFGKQFRQGNRIYHSENIAMCLKWLSQLETLEVIAIYIN